MLLGGVLLPSIPFVKADTGSSVDYGYTITNYVMDMDVQTDNSMHITETITVSFGDYATYGASHGIYRYIPTLLTVTRAVDGEYKDYTYGTDINLIRATITNNGTSYEDAYTENDNYVILLREDGLVNGQTRTYSIVYDYAIGYDRITTGDELYYNLLGDSWNTTIEQFSFTVTMPKNANEVQTDYAYAPVFYSGTFGTNTPSAIVNYNVADNVITGSTTASVAPYEAVTIWMSLPEGYFNDVTTFNIVWDILLLVVVVVGLAGIAYIYMTKRNYKRVVQTVEFYPPKGMDPIHLAYALQGYVTTKQLTSLIIYFASKGYLKIIDENGALSLQKVKDLPKSAKVYETMVFNGLFEKGTIIKSEDLSKYFSKEKGKQIAEALKAKNAESVVYEPISLKELQKNQNTGKAFFNASKTVSAICGNRIDANSIKYSALMAVFGVIPIILFVALYSLRMHTSYGFSAIAIVVVLSILSSLFFYSAFSPVAYRKKDRPKKWHALIGLAIFALSFVAMASVYWENVIDPLFNRVLILLPILSTLVAVVSTIQFNETYRDIVGKILGFRKNIILTEKKRMELLLKDNPSYYYDILPYAYVMNITDEFTKNFEGLTLQAPGWYVSNNAVFNVIMFNSLMRSSFNSFTNQIVSRNQASGFGGTSVGGGFGGGFSGGGFGGGGGGRA